MDTQHSEDSRSALNDGDATVNELLEALGDADPGQRSYWGAGYLEKAVETDTNECPERLIEPGALFPDETDSA